MYKTLRRVVRLTLLWLVLAAAGTLWSMLRHDGSTSSAAGIRDAYLGSWDKGVVFASVVTAAVVFWVAVARRTRNRKEG